MPMHALSAHALSGDFCVADQNRLLRCPVLPSVAQGLGREADMLYHRLRSKGWLERGARGESDCAQSARLAVARSLTRRCHSAWKLLTDGCSTIFSGRLLYTHTRPSADRASMSEWCWPRGFSNRKRCREHWERVLAGWPSNGASLKSSRN